MVPSTHKTKDDIVIKVTHDEVQEIADESTDAKKPSAYWDINCMHGAFNHAGEEAL
jgi:hypothetical protein